MHANCRQIRAGRTGFSAAAPRAAIDIGAGW
jgi:hypothetical protein